MVAADKLLSPTMVSLTSAGIENARLEVGLLLAYVLGISREALLMEHEITLTDAQQKHFEHVLGQRLNRVPMAQIVGRREFWGMEFQVTRDTLTPRPDSETVIESLLAHCNNRQAPLKMLDLGTGTGCLLLAALSEYPLSTGLGVDLSEAALSVAKANAKALGLEKRVEFKKSDWNSEVNGVWDIVISNPPYIPTEEIPRLAPEVARYEPVSALDGGSDGLGCYRAITRFLPTVLAEKGIALLEVGAGQSRAVADMAAACGLKPAGVTCDLAGIERCVILQK